MYTFVFDQKFWISKDSTSNMLIYINFTTRLLSKQQGFRKIRSYKITN